MAAKNDITGDSIQTRTVTDTYRDNYDRIFGKKKNHDAPATDDPVRNIHTTPIDQHDQPPAMEGHAPDQTPDPSGGNDTEHP